MMSPLKGKSTVSPGASSCRTVLAERRQACLRRANSSRVHALDLPVFADIDPATFNLDITQVESFLRGGRRDKLRALLPVHLYGQCADMDALQPLADEFHLSIIEDAAQAIGARWSSEPGKARSAGTMAQRMAPGSAAHHAASAACCAASGERQLG